MPAESTILVLGVTDSHLRALVREQIGVYGAVAHFETPPGNNTKASAVVLFVEKSGPEQVRACRCTAPRALIAITENDSFSHAQALLDAGADEVLLRTQLERLPVSLAAAAKAVTARSRHDQDYALQKAVNDHSPTEIFVKDIHGRYLYVNRATAERYANVDDDFIGKRPEEILAPAEAAAIVEHDRDVLENGQVVKGIVSFLGHHLHVTKFPIYGGEDIIGLGAIAVDVSEQQKTLQALRTSEKRLFDYAELAADIFYETGPDWLLTRCDGRLQEITGLHTCSIIATERPEITRQDREKYPEKWHALKERLKRHEAVSGFELEWTRNDGQQITLLNNIKPMFDHGGEFVGYRGVAVDVTALRDTQRALRKEEEHFRFVVENSNDFVTVLDERGLIRYQSPSVAEETGYPMSDRIGKSPLLYVHPDDRDYVKTAIDVLLSQAGRIETLVYRFQLGDRDWRHIESRCRSVAAESGTLEIIVNSRDVSKRVAVEEALREAEHALRVNEERFRSLIENSSDVITVLDCDGLIRFQSPSVTRVLGYGTEEMVGHNPLDYIHADDQQQTLSAIRHILSHAGNTESVVFRLRHKHGDWREFESHGRSAVHNDEMELILNSRDITDRRLAESALRDSEQLLRAMLDNSPVATFIKDSEERFVYVNKVGRELLQAKSTDVIGRTAMEVWPDSPSAGLAAEQDRQVLETGTSIVRETSMKYSAGTRNILIHKFPVYNAKGDMAGVAGVGIDITERVTAEQARRDSEELLRGIMNHSPNAVFMKDLEKRYVYINKRCEELFGVADRHAKGKRALAIFPLQVAQQMENHDKRVIKKERTLIDQQDVPYVDGTHTVITAKFPIRDAAGKVVSIGAVVTDITESSAAVRALRVSEEHFRNLVEGSLQGILIHNLQEVLFVNQAFLDIFGYASLDEIKAAYTERRVIAEHDRDRIRRYAESRLVDGAEPQRYEFDGVNADGSLMQIEASGRRINWQGKPALQTTVLDITERKRAEQALQKELRRNQIVLETSQDGFFTCDLNGNLQDTNRLTSICWDTRPAKW